MKRDVTSAAAMRPLLVLALLMALPAAGCLESAPGPGGDDAGGGDAPRDDTFRDVGSGQQSGYDGSARLVLPTQEAYEAFWREHQTDTLSGGASPPAVAYPDARAVAVVLEQKPDACWAVRVTNATGEATRLTLEVTTYSAPPDRACAQVLTKPWHVVAIANDGRDVAFEEVAVTGPPTEARG